MCRWRHSYSAGREPPRDLRPSLPQVGCSHEHPEMRRSHELSADLSLLAPGETSGGDQLFGSDALVVAGRESENRASHHREIDRASERCETAGCKLIVFIEPLHDLKIIGAGEIDGARVP